MFKTVVSVVSAFLVSCGFVFAAPQASAMGNSMNSMNPMGMPQTTMNYPMDLNQMGPPRPDRLDYTSPQAQMTLKRAQYILSTLVHDPQSYQLILSSQTTFGGEAWPPYVYSDKPTMVIYQGALMPNHSNEEVAFMMAHELGHLNLYHNEKTAQDMDKVMLGPPIGISGSIYNVFYKKLQEREADLFGLYMYKRAGYDPSFFARHLQIIKRESNLHFHDPYRKELGSLSPKDTHFTMKERFELLTSKAYDPIS